MHFINIQSKTFMSTLDLNTIDVRCLSNMEMEDINGGVIPVAAYLIGSFVVGLIIGIYIGTR